MTQKITVTLHAEDATPSGILNAVRRASSQLTTVTAEPVTVKGVTFKATPVKAVPFASKQAIRTWAAENGHPEVVGKRGRLPKAVLEAYAAAHK